MSGSCNQGGRCRLPAPRCYTALQAAWDNRTAIYLASSGCAEFIADLFLCPLEAVRIRSVSDKAFPQSLPGERGHGLTGVLATV